MRKAYIILIAVMVVNVFSVAQTRAAGSPKEKSTKTGEFCSSDREAAKHLGVGVQREACRQSCGALKKTRYSKTLSSVWVRQSVGL
jgi:hypothetical protein